ATAVHPELIRYIDFFFAQLQAQTTKGPGDLSLLKVLGGVSVGAAPTPPAPTPADQGPGPPVPPQGAGRLVRGGSAEPHRHSLRPCRPSHPPPARGQAAHPPDGHRLLGGRRGSGGRPIRRSEER